MKLDLETIRAQVEKRVGSGPATKKAGNLPDTPRARKVLAYAGREARSLGHSYVGTEHLLLGLLRESEGVAAPVLKDLPCKSNRCGMKSARNSTPGRRSLRRLRLRNEELHTARNRC